MPKDPFIREKFAEEYARIRAPRGVTVAQASDTVTDGSYFGTMRKRPASAVPAVRALIARTQRMCAAQARAIHLDGPSAVVSIAGAARLADNSRALSPARSGERREARRE